MKSPKDILLPYERRWVDDESRFKIGCWARQTGKSFTMAEETVEDCLKHKTMWVTLSAGERQALEWLMKAKEWAAAYKIAIEDYLEDRESAEALMKSAEIKWPNGSRSIAIPANPATARGYSANLNLDEFAFHEKPNEIWRAIYPSISNPLKGLFKIRIASTPNGKANKFYDLWTKNKKYSKHFIDIYAAVREGLPLDVEELKEGLDDPEGWAQEYECQFIDAASILLPYELLAACENAEAVEEWEPQRILSQNPLYLGVDIGRKKDLTVFWLLEKIGDVLWTAGIKVFEKTPFNIQFDFLSAVLRSPAIRHCCIDATGIGAMMAEEAARHHGKYRVEECQFTAPFKQEIFTNVRRIFEDKTVRIPVSRAIREDLHGMQKITTASGGIRYLAPHSDDGHCDRATALALALQAAKGPGGIFHSETFKAGRAVRQPLRERQLV